MCINRKISNGIVNEFKHQTIRIVPWSTGKRMRTTPIKSIKNVKQL